MQTVLDKTKSTELYQREFDASPEIREEFGQNFETYSAYRLGEDQGLISPGNRGKHPLSTLQVLEKIKLEWEVTYSARNQFGSFDAYRKHRWEQEMTGR